MIQSWIHPSRWLSLIILAVVGKFVLMIVFAVEHGMPLTGPWYYAGGDSATYLGPIDSLLAGNGYFPDLRMPGYGAIYLVARLLLPPAGAMQALVLVQTLCSGLLAVLLAQFAYRQLNDLRIFRWVFLLTLVSTFTSIWDLNLLTESFSAFALVIALYALTVQRWGRRVPLVIAGAALTWLIFMKPVFLPLLPLFALALWLKDHHLPWQHRSLAILVFLAPFVLIDGAWILRNYKEHRRVQPLTGSAISPSLLAGEKYPVMRLMQAYGCNYVWWDPTAEILWFNVRIDNTVTLVAADSRPPLPGYTATKACPDDSLRAIANDLGAIKNLPAGPEREQLLATIRARCDGCRTAFMEEHPFHYAITSRLRLLKLFTLVSGTEALMGKPAAELPVFKLVVKVFYSLLYLASTILGTIAAFLVLFRSSNPVLLRLVGATALYGVFIFPFGVRMCENRYLTTVHPLLLFLAVWIAFQAIDRFRSKHPRLH
jgi:hypothetical protein